MTTPKVIDGASAVKDLISELDRTRRDYAKATLALSQAESTAQQLRETITARDRLVSQLQHEVVERDATHRMEVAAVAHGGQTTQQVSEQRTRHLESELARMKKELDVVGDYVAQNQQLRQVLTQCYETLGALHKANAELRAQVATEVRARTQHMEEEFSRRLLESERRLRQDAFNALSEEARVALAGNDKLQTVLQRQNETLDSVLERCHNLEAAQVKIDQERRLIAGDTVTQDREVARLQQILGNATDRASQLEDALKQRRAERASFELLFLEYNTMKQDLVKEKEKARRAAKEAQRWREKAFALTEQLAGDAQTDAIAKLHAIAQHSELLERNAERNRRRKERLQAVKHQNAQVSQAVADFENGIEPSASSNNKGSKKMMMMTHDDDDDDHDNGEDGSDYYYDDDKEGQHTGGGSGGGAGGADGVLPPRDSKLKVNAMDILAIWNVNYENEDAGYVAGSRGGSNNDNFGSSGNHNNNSNNHHHHHQTSSGNNVLLLHSNGATKSPNSQRHQQPQSHSTKKGHQQQQQLQLPAPQTTKLPSILRVDAERANKDAALSVQAQAKPPGGSFAARRMQSSVIAQSRTLQTAAANSVLALTGQKQEVPGVGGKV